MTTFSELTKDFDPERRVSIEQRKEQLRQTLVVLRAAVDQVIPADALYARSCCEFVGEGYRAQLLAIADELAHKTLQNPPDEV